MRGECAGWHLTIQAVVAEDHVPLLSDASYLDAMFRDLIALLKMEILVEPTFADVPLDPARLATDDDEGGVTGTVVITTSHGAIHTWPLRQRFAMDVFSCQEFDPEQALAFICDRLRVAAERHQFDERAWPVSRGG
jgi:S-adenosylmethionine/arginine decarboxylase-like enzyme